MSFPTVWLYDFSGDSHTLPELRALLGGQRYSYCSNMKNETAALRSAYAFLLLRYALKKEYGVTEIPTFTFNEYGKPFLKERPDLFFSLSHSGKRVVCAVDIAPVGADIQDIRDISLRTGEKFLEPNEYNIFSRITDEKKLSYELSMIWCVKESYGKMTGKGFGEGFRSFSAEDLLLSEQTAFVTERDGFFISVCTERKRNGRELNV